MSIHITDDLSSMVAGFTRQGGSLDNPLRLGSNGDETPTRDIILAALRDLGDRRSDVAASLKKILEQRSNGLVDIDTVTAALIAHISIEPLTVAWLSAVCGGLTIMRNDDFSSLIHVDGQLAPDESSMCQTEVRIGEHAWWRASGTMMVYGIPSTMGLAAVGRPLASIVSHPVLDALKLKVSRVQLPEEGESTDFDVDFVHTFPSVSQIAAMRPAS